MFFFKFEWHKWEYEKEESSWSKEKLRLKNAILIALYIFTPLTRLKAILILLTPVSLTTHSQTGVAITWGWGYEHCINTMQGSIHLFPKLQGHSWLHLEKKHDRLTHILPFYTD